MEVLLIIGLVWVLPMVFIGMMTSSRGRSMAWLLWPLFLGWLGWLIAFLMLVNQPKVKQ